MNTEQSNATRARGLGIHRREIGPGGYRQGECDETIHLKTSRQETREMIMKRRANGEGEGTAWWIIGQQAGGQTKDEKSDGCGKAMPDGCKGRLDGNKGKTG